MTWFVFWLYFWKATKLPLSLVLIYFPNFWQRNINFHFIYELHCQRSWRVFGSFLFFWLVYSFWKPLSTSVDKKQNKKCWHFAQWFLLPLLCLQPFLSWRLFFTFYCYFVWKRKVTVFSFGRVENSMVGGRGYHPERNSLKCRGTTLKQICP